MKMSTTGRETSCDQSASLQEDATKRWQWVVIGCGDEQRPGQSWKKGLRVDCVRVYTNKSAAEADLVTLKFVLRLLQRHCARHMATSRSKRAFFRCFNVLRALGPTSAVVGDCHRCVAKVEKGRLGMVTRTTRSLMPSYIGPKTALGPASLCSPQEPQSSVPQT